MTKPDRPLNGRWPFKCTSFDDMLVDLAKIMVNAARQPESSITFFSCNAESHSSDGRSGGFHRMSVELLKNGDFHEYKGGRGEFLLIQSYDMFVSTLAQAVVRARTFAPGEKMSVFAVVTTPGQHPKKRIPLGFHGVSDQKEGQFLKRKEFACLYF